MEKLKKKGVKIKIAAPMTKDTKPSLKSISGVADVKHSSDIKARFCIVDGKQLIFMVQDDQEVHPTYDIGIWVNTPFYASAMEGLFNNVWKGLKNPR